MDKNIIIKDLQNCQRQIGRDYYNFACDCAHPNLKIDFLSFAREESDIIGWLNYEFDSESVPPREYAPEEQVSEAYQKYSTH